ncbi:MAG: F0F1 ATP synthase subunit gamma [Paracoccaceae bacterium]|nr:F0F1 ATP synthase subunit gamma [Paracoccaceae bacterium]MDE2676143.1 F0F1 ATP synthase subunit gamma [Paracoccaceae bacterium]MXZ49563.1 F0F1 ATP synthase subunit gamma [Paracoccaceae bacterium]MYF44921.1 F0F1 ATP synthase subunit gamma [Paracoccaceae bacterium]MYI90538.1 F0F1 ATP synthase subunit gamma [Paracoccaceae bacterium]
MPSLKDLKIRIESVKSTRKITKAMQMVAAAKLRRAQEAAERARPYSEKMDKVVTNLASSFQGEGSAPKVMSGSGSDQVHLLIVATAERGLCGGFNSSIVRLARQHARNLIGQNKQVKILTIGKKGREQLKREFESYFIDHVDLTQYKIIRFSIAQEIGEKVLDLFEHNEFDVATVFFSRFQSVITQDPTAQQIIPVEVKEDNGEKGFYDFEPDETELLVDLLPQAIINHIFTALLENAASEQGARMSAMDNATRNAGEMIDKLTIVYNRSRQAAITKELIEIISGAEAL